MAYREARTTHNAAHSEPQLSSYCLFFAFVSKLERMKVQCSNHLSMSVSMSVFFFEYCGINRLLSVDTWVCVPRCPLYNSPRKRLYFCISSSFPCCSRPRPRPRHVTCLVSFKSGVELKLSYWTGEWTHWTILNEENMRAIG
jgi:hypothetical protein